MDFIVSTRLNQGPRETIRTFESARLARAVCWAIRRTEYQDWIASRASEDGERGFVEMHQGGDTLVLTYGPR